MNPLFQIPEDLSALSVDGLEQFISEARDQVDAVTANPSEYVGEERTFAQLMEELSGGVAAIESARAELASREDELAETPEPVADAIDADALAELAARAHAEPEPVEETPAAEEENPDEELALETPAVEETPAETETVTAAAPEPQPRLARPARRRAAAPVTVEERIAMTAAAENLGPSLGQDIGMDEIARMMIKRRGMFGHIAEGTRGERIPVAKASWSERYPDERRLGANEIENGQKIEAVVASAVIKERMAERKRDAASLTASGGLCAPVTPYYNLAMISQASRPVRDSLAAFNADRGGIRTGRPASLSAIDTAVGRITEAQDHAGGSDAVKVCQVIDCPQFVEVDVAAIYHCLQFGNLGARAFPELVAQWSSLVLAAQARTAETALLDGIAAASTAVTADNLGLGASASLPSQILAAAAGMRSRHRMDPDAVLRAMLPEYIPALLVSDVYRSQFQRFDMTPERFVAVLRAANIEPTFYLDGTTGGGQVFGAQAAADLLPFPATAEWFLHPEGSFLFLDGGTLELGLVRDSSLNSTNDFELFGETWEEVAYVGVESLKITSTLCDSGTVSLPGSVTCPIDYAAA